MSLRLHLPPNLATAVIRNAVPVRVEFDEAVAPSPSLFPALALLQRWCATPKPPAFLQLTRTQLRELAAALGSAPVFVENGRAGPWAHRDLLKEVPTAAPTGGSATPVTPAAPRNRPDYGTPMVIDGSEHFLSITLPSREHPGYESAFDLIKSSGFILEPSNRKWWLRDRHKTLAFLAKHRARLEKSFGAEFTPNFEKNTTKIKSAGVDLSAEMQGDGLKVSLGIHAGKADETQIRAAIASNRNYVESDGAIYLIDPESVQRLEKAQRVLAGDPNSSGTLRRTHKVSAARAAEVEDVLEELSPGFESPAAWREKSGALKNLSVLKPAPAPEALNALMRPYQKIGAAWLWHLHRNGLGGILADEMGLGKTIQALALISAEASLNGGTTLVVCPASLVENWRREAVRFTPGLSVLVHHGAGRFDSAAEVTRSKLVITSYGTLARDRELFSEIDFGCVIADEAQHIKNRKSQNAQALRSLRAKGRFLLTGTPLENSWDDLRSLFEFLLPGYLEKIPPGLKGDERRWYDERLKAKTAPYILRRTKRLVAPELPEKIEQVIWCDFTAPQRALYTQIQQRNERELIDLAAKGATEGSLKFAALTQLLRLRQVCCDPRLVAAERKDADSAKLEVFRELIAEAADDGHRILVFSQFTGLLGLLREDLERQEIVCCYLDGSMTPKARQAEVDRFQADAAIPLFLISLKAGGTGLNLTGADTVIHFDPWWNPAAEAQATDRAHRIGQTKTVTSYKLICAGSVEEKVLALQTEKRALLESVFEASDATAAALSLDDLKALLAT